MLEGNKENVTQKKDFSKKMNWSCQANLKKRRENQIKL